MIQYLLVGYNVTSDHYIEEPLIVSEGLVDLKEVRARLEKEAAEAEAEEAAANKDQQKGKAKGKGKGQGKKPGKDKAKPDQAKAR